ncbi:hypothetical protein KY285_012279 [Solanum tuberosum]|nr:hypothetical protein KY285_012279 [Solanum tuberosum]
MDVYVTLRFHHGGKLQQKPRIKYEGVKEIGYNCSACVVYIKPPKCRRVVEVKSDRDIMGILKNLLCPPPFEIGYLNDVDGESNTTFDKESNKTFEGSEGLGFEEDAQPTQPEEPIMGEVLGRTSASVGEDLGRASAGVGEDLGRASVSVGEDLGEASDDSDNADLSAEGEDEYGSDVHEEVINLRKEKRVAKIKKRKEKGPRSEGVDLGYDEYLSKKQTTFEGKIAGDEPYFDSDKAVSFEIDTDEDVNEEDEVEQPIRRQRKTRRAKRNKKKVVFDPTYQLIVWETGLAFESVQQFREAITRYAVQEHVELDKYVNDATRVRVKCTVGCPWLLFGSIDSRTRDFVVKNYNPVHKCNGTTKNKLVNSKYLSERYKDRIISEPGIRVFQFQILVKKELNVYVGRTVARKARNIVLKQIMGDHVEEFKRILDYRDELLKTNPGSTCVAIAAVENTFTWKWFIKLVRHDLELGDGTKLTTITDMQKGLDKAIQDLLPNAKQRMCARHVLANWSKYWKGIERRIFFWRCAKSTYE